MFEAHHMIYQYAHYHDDLSEYLEYAEELIFKWEAQDHPVEFQTAFEIRIASFLLMDGLLPDPAIRAIAVLTINAVNEAEDQKLNFKTLKVKPPKRGRKRDNNAVLRVRETKELVDGGMSKGLAYATVAEKHHRATDTIRREFERAYSGKKKRMT